MGSERDKERAQSWEEGRGPWKKWEGLVREKKGVWS